jgi:Caspase domain
MARVTARALLVGSQLAPLTGVGNDLDLMHGLLSGRGFADPDIRRLEGDAATRDGIFSAFADLAGVTAVGDPVVVYYSGHGGLAVDTTDAQRTAQYIAPTDYAQSSPGDFRGITAEELSVLLATLTTRTGNVSMILDCCHSAQMAGRTPKLLAKAIPGSTYVDVTAHNQKVHAFLAPRGLVADLQENRNAVKLAACAAAQTTYEFEERGQKFGMFTFFLADVLAGSGTAPLTWSALIPSMRRQIRLFFPGQSPEAEGPSNRLLFSVEPGDVTGVLTATRTPAGATLGGGRIVGVAPDDRYVVVPTGDPDLRHLVATLSVRSVTDTEAQADVTLEPGQAELPRIADARPVARAMPTFPVVVAPDPALDAIRVAAAASIYVRPVADRPDEPVLAWVDPDPAGMLLRDAVGPATEPGPVDDAGVRTLVRNLDRMARALQLRELDDGDPALRDAFDVSWGTVEAGAQVPAPLTGMTLFTDESIYVGLENTGPTTLFGYLFSIDAGSAVTLLTPNDPNGISLVTGQKRVVARRDVRGAIVGLPMGWPDDVPRDRPRPESLLVLALTSATDLRMLEQEAVQGPPRAGVSPLEEALHQIMGGTPRGVRGRDTSSVVRRIDYQLVDAPRPRAGHGAFLLDERPDISLALLGVIDDASADLTVEVVELVLRQGHPLLGPDLRLDVLVGTVDDGGAPVHATDTARLPSPQAGVDLVLPGRRLHTGPARGLLDVAVWLSRDAGNAAPLADLLAGHVADPLPDAAAGRMTTAVGRLDAVTALVDAAGDALGAVAAAVTGLYRASFLGSHAFGAGEHPVGQLGTEQDVALRLRVSSA